MAKSMTEEEASTLMVILEPYLEHIRNPQNAQGDSCPGSLLPRFFGAYVYEKDGLFAGVFGQRICFTVTANVFAGVPKDVMSSMERFDLKGSADDRAQRKPGGEFMCFDLIRRDQKFAPVRAPEGEQLLAQLERDTAFLLAQHMPRGPLGLVDYDQLPENYRGAPGLMDYSLLVGVVPCGTPGGYARMDVREQRLALEVGEEEGGRSGEDPPAEDSWQVQAAGRTVLLGIIDILQFWTPRKRIARRLKKLMHMERDDDNEYNGAMLDTVRPEHYRPRFMAFMREAFSEGSWTDSIPRLYGRRGSGTVQRLIDQLPEPQKECLRLSLTCGLEASPEAEAAGETAGETAGADG